MGCEALQAAQLVIDMAQLPLCAAEFNRELHQSLESVFPESELMPGIVEMYVYMHR